MSQEEGQDARPALAVADVAEEANKIIAEVEKVIVGKSETIRLSVLTMLCGGHLLLEDIPGVGKTTLAKALALSIGGDFRRVQFTPDLLPADVTGTSIYNQSKGDFEFKPGPLFGNIVLVDEINRATPKTQSALLEAMEERQITSDGVTRNLPEPFFVIATQNNIEMTGTYPLPEAQLDRFFSMLSLGYPERDDEVHILGQQQVVHPIESVEQVTTLSRMVSAQHAVRELFVHETVRGYIVDLIRQTRGHPQLQAGASPRGSLQVMRAAQAHAAMRGADFVMPDDVKAVGPYILSHRVLPKTDLRTRGASSREVISNILSTLPAPVPTAK
ncbi:MAG: MoxR family ATPase [Fimbriimonadaceae bacterium]|nr:MoxR family ATPase [Fimbriimonadaceae bacterium]